MGQTGSNETIGARLAPVTRAARAVALGLACTGAAALLARAAGDRATLPAPRTDTLVAAGVLGLGAAAAAWLALGCLALLASTLLAAAGRVPAALDRAVGRLTPRLLRRAVGAGLGAGLAVGSWMGPALALETPPPLGWQVTEVAGRDAVPTATVASPSVVAPTPAPTVAPTSTTPAAPEPATAGAGPATPVAEATQDPAPTHRATTAVEPVTPPAAAGLPAGTPPAASGPAVPATPARATVVVRPGDCLWSIAAAHLPAGASDAEIAAAWPAWYTANAAVVGADPDLLVPGQVLLAPPAGAR